MIDCTGSAPTSTSTLRCPTPKVIARDGWKRLPTRRRLRSHVLPAEEMGEAPEPLAAELDDDDLLDDALGVDDRASENLEQRPEEDVRVGRTSTGDDLSADANA